MFLPLRETKLVSAHAFDETLLLASAYGAVTALNVTLVLLYVAHVPCGPIAL